MNALNALRIHMRRYPQSEPQDWIKLLYQSEFGPGHFVEAGAVLARLKSGDGRARAAGGSAPV